METRCEEVKSNGRVMGLTTRCPRKATVTEADGSRHCHQHSYEETARRRLESVNKMRIKSGLEPLTEL